MLAFQAVDDAKALLLPASAVPIRLLTTARIVGSIAPDSSLTRPLLKENQPYVVASLPVGV